MKKIVSPVWCGVLLAFLFGFGCASAQAVAQVEPPLPIAPAPGTGAPLNISTLNTQPVVDVGAKPVEVVWVASLDDGTVRSVVTKWAVQAGWFFSPEHWSVDRDLPIRASAEFRGEFRDVVRSLLETTELSDVPVQPCFYSNKVVRVVPRAQICDRGTAER